MKSKLSILRALLYDQLPVTNQDHTQCHYFPAGMSCYAREDERVSICIVVISACCPRCTGAMFACLAVVLAQMQLKIQSSCDIRRNNAQAIVLRAYKFQTCN
jgi:hypothetical protein